jgi:ATP-binding cassette subfamily F protein 3
VVTRITDIGLRTLTDYPGNYSRFVTERDARMDRLRQAKRDQDEEVARIQAFINRFRYQATKAAQVQSRIKMLDKIVRIDVPPERQRVRFTFPTCPKSGRTVLELDGVRKAYGDNVVLNDINAHIERGDRIALVAPNGAGKSTLMRILAGAEPPDQGERREGHQVVMQYFAQDEANRLDPTKTVYGTMEADSPVGMVPMIRNILGGFLFSGDDIHKPARVLSGGERTRLAVARMLLRPANTLLLDEPTNHLDLDSKDVLLEALEDFGGTLIFVSHDRYFVDRLANKIISVGNGAIELYPGTYEQFLWSREQRDQEADSPAANPPSRKGRRAPEKAQQKPNTRQAVGKPTAGSAVDRRPSYAEKKRADAEARRARRANEARQRRLAELEARIADREKAIKDIEEQMATSGFYDNRESAAKTVDKHQSLMWEVGNLMEQWESLQSAEASEPTK